MTTLTKSILTLLFSSGGLTLYYTLPGSSSPVPNTKEDDRVIKFSDGNKWLSKSLVKEYPGLQNYPETLKQAEESKKKDPVYYRYWYDNPFQRTVEPEEAKQKLTVLMDHTILLSYSYGCPIGTAWILDYVLPEEGQTYPTKFFLASAGHVVNAIKWDESNPYDQVLSDPEKDLAEGWKKGPCFSKGGAEITLTKERVSHEDEDFDRESSWKNTVRHENMGMRRVEERYDVSKHRGSKKNPQSDLWQFTIEKPKLVYFPHNYLENETKDHVADFAVFEVDFKDETIAKLFTRNFYGKYDRVKGTSKNKALNLFAKPLYDRYTSKQILEKDLQVWMAGYPNVGLPNRASTSYNIRRKSSSRFTFANNNMRDKYGRLLIGHAPANEDNVSWRWNGQTVTEEGYLYVFDYPEIGTGASGSLVAGDDGEVLGVYSIVDHNVSMGGATPLRNAEIKDKDGRVINKAYDLLEGVEGQRSSYKDQIKKYVLKNGQQTSLSQFRNW